eukprot:6471653-Amphidinium_carterae.1
MRTYLNLQLIVLLTSLSGMPLLDKLVPVKIAGWVALRRLTKALMPLMSTQRQNGEMSTTECVIALLQIINVEPAGIQQNGKFLIMV